jgi:hypothetical protein
LQVFPNERYGCNYDVNWSVTLDGVAAQGDAFAMAPVRNLIMYSNGKPTAQRALASSDASEPATGMSTDSFPGFATMDLDSFEDLNESVTARLQERKRLFIEDGAVGSYRTTEIKVRVISDRPEAALFFRNMLVPVPLRSAEFFPRNILVIDGSMHGTGFDGTETPSEAPLIASDIDPDAATSRKATVIVRGKVPLTQIMQHVAHCATQLAALGGYKHLHGSTKTDEDADDHGYVLAKEGEPQPSFLVLPGDVVLGKGGATAVLGADGAVAAAAASATNLIGARESAGSAATQRAAAGATTGVVAAHHFAWDEDRVSGVWGGLAMPAAAMPGKGKAALEALPRGAISLNRGALVASGIAAPRVCAHPTRLAVVADAKPGAVDPSTFVDVAAAAFHMSDDEAAMLLNRINSTAPELVVVPTAADALSRK